VSVINTKLKRKIVELHDNGKSFSEIGKELWISYWDGKDALLFSQRSGIGTALYTGEPICTI